MDDNTTLFLKIMAWVIGCTLFGGIVVYIVVRRNDKIQEKKWRE